MENRENQWTQWKLSVGVPTPSGDSGVPGRISGTTSLRPSNLRVARSNRAERAQQFDDRLLPGSITGASDDAGEVLAAHAACRARRPLRGYALAVPDGAWNGATLVVIGLLFALGVAAAVRQDEINADRALAACREQLVDRACACWMPEQP